MILRLFQSGVLLSYGLIIAWYYWSGKLPFLVNPIYDRLILVGGLILAVFGGFLLFTIRAHRHHRHRLSFRQLGQGLLWLFPLVILVIFTPRPLSSQSALIRGVTQELSTGGGQSPLAFGKPPQERELMEWVRILNHDPEPSHHAGQPVSIEVMVLTHDDLPENYFYASRFLLTCCAADVRSIVMPVRYDPLLFTPRADDWIRLEGEIAEDQLQGHRQAVIDYKKHQAIEVPANPYFQ